MKKTRIFTAVEETDPIEGKILVITDLWYNGRAEVKRTRQSVKAQAGTENGVQQLIAGSEAQTSLISLVVGGRFPTLLSGHNRFRLT